jgi:hypothetical protein
MGQRDVHDVKATHVEDSIFRFTTVESGRPFNISDSSGRVLIRDRGAIRQAYLFDTEDHTPGGVFLELLSERVPGTHPGSFMTEGELCAMVTPLLS